MYILSCIAQQLDVSGWRLKKSRVEWKVTGFFFLVLDLENETFITLSLDLKLKTFCCPIIQFPKSIYKNLIRFVYGRINRYKWIQCVIYQLNVLRESSAWTGKIWHFVVELSNFKWQTKIFMTSFFSHLKLFGSSFCLLHARVYGICCSLWNGLHSERQYQWPRVMLCMEQYE